ncbi:hypothetical protein BGZ49_007647 [Haplosporangium sp. Z 27]|nr:hypothetical protein BGZ49_007647 [Haplosporangium sp. Z 27]
MTTGLYHNHCKRIKAVENTNDTLNWYFLECRIDQPESVASTDLNRAKFRTPTLDEIINYRKDKWQDDAAAVLDQIVWLTRKMVSEITKREIRLKRHRNDGRVLEPSNDLLALASLKFVRAR